jgi:hypothetical protein
MTKLTELLTAEQIQQLKEGIITIDQIVIATPEKSEDKSKKYYDVLEGWLQQVTKGKTPDDSCAEFWFVLSTIGRINYLEDKFNKEEELRDFSSFVSAIEAEHTTAEIFEALVNTVSLHPKFLKSLVNSSLVTKPRRKRNEVKQPIANSEPVELTKATEVVSDTPFIA